MEEEIPTPQSPDLIEPSSTAARQPEDEASNPELEQRLVNFFEQLPQLPVSSIISEMQKVNDLLTTYNIPEEERLKRLQSVAEGVVTYKSGPERVEGEIEGPWFLGEEKAFRQELAQRGLVPREFARIPLRQVIPRAIGEAIGFSMVTIMNEPIQRKLWTLNAKLWKKTIEEAKEIPKLLGAIRRGEEYTPPWHEDNKQKPPQNPQP